MLGNARSAVPIEWLVRLRWFFLGGQLIAIVLATCVFATELHWLPLVLALTLSAGSNLLLFLRSRRKEAKSPARLMGAILILDVVLLTIVLASSGGATNPFTVLFLVYITLSAVVLSAGWTAAVAVMSVAGFGILFLLSPTGNATGSAGAMHHGAHHAMSGQSGFDEHLQGMWAAFVLATALTAFFVGRISHWLAAQREQIAGLREASAHNARLAALTTLAAGAAHELNSPLGTIALAAHEASRHSKTLTGAGAITEDLRLILLEVDRCQEILHRMAAQAAEPDPGGEPLSVGELTELIQEYLGSDKRSRIDLTFDNAEVLLPSTQIVPSIVALIQNALDASEEQQRVGVDIRLVAGRVQVDITDTGTGMPEELLNKVGEPFFTTKEPGAGLGLGVFLARAVFESRGGELTIESKLGQGTRARVTLPSTNAAVAS